MQHWRTLSEYYSKLNRLYYITGYNLIHISILNRIRNSASSPVDSDDGLIILKADKYNNHSFIQFLVPLSSSVCLCPFLKKSALKRRHLNLQSEWIMCEPAEPISRIRLSSVFQYSPMTSLQTPQSECLSVQALEIQYGNSMSLSLKYLICNDISNFNV